MAEDTKGIEYLSEMFDGILDGYLIDVGAKDGVKSGSMSRKLILQGWGGLMVEPLPSSYALLHQAYKNCPNVHTVHAACSDSEGTAQLLPCRGVSTLDPLWAKACSDWWKHVEYGEPIRVIKNRLSVLLELYNAPRHINFLQIDTEGHDFFVLRGMDWTRQVDVVCVETLDMVHPERKIGRTWYPNIEMDAYLKSLGFKLSLLTRGGNAFYAREEVQ